MGDLIDRDEAIKAVKVGALSAATIYGRTDEGSTALYETVRAIKAIPSAQPEPLKIHLDPELTKEECERLMRIGASPVIPPDRQEITVESAVGFLQSIGWMQEHDKAIYKHGKSKGIKRGRAMARRKEAGGD